MNKIYIRRWRVINLIMIISGLALPWVKIYFDTQYAGYDPAPLAGWRHFLSMWQVIISDLFKYGFDIDLLPLWIISLSAFLIFLYLIFNLFSAIKNGNHKANKVISIILIGTIVTFLFEIYIGGKPALGYWLTNLGVFSSAVLEWQS